MHLETEMSMRFLLIFTFLASVLLAEQSPAVWVEDQGFSTQEVLLTDSLYLTKLELTGPRGEHIRETIRKTRPQVQKALLVRDQLPSIVEAYQQTVSDPQSAQFVKLIKQIYEARDSIVDRYHVKFEFDTGSFRVIGVDPNRIAVNTGREIIFDAKALGAKSQSLSDLTTIWLHEILHTDQTTPLEVRDAWAGKVGAWISERTMEAETSDGKKLTLLKLIPLPEKRLERYPIDLPQQHIIDTQKSSLLLLEDASGTRVLSEVYAGLRTFMGSVNEPIPQWERQAYALQITWPKVQITGLKVLPDGRLQLDYNQSTELYSKTYSNFARNVEYPKTFPTDTATEPKFPVDQFRAVYDLKTDGIELQRLYHVPLQDGDFEVHRVQDAGKRRFVSLRLNIPNSLKPLQLSSTVQLLGKNVSGDAPLQSILVSHRYINRDEVLLHFEVPPDNIELQRIVLPVVDAAGMYSEMVLRPTKPVSLLGTKPLSIKQTGSDIKKFTVKPRASGEGPVETLIRLKSPKRIVGVSLDIDHLLSVSRTEWVGSMPQTMKKDLGFLGQGRKYFFSRKQLRQKFENEERLLSFQIPLELMNQIGTGPTVQREYGWMYKQTHQLKTSTMDDTKMRKITGAWLHFSDGTTEKISTNALPERFSLISEAKRTEEREMLVRQYMSNYDIAPEEPVPSTDRNKPKTCKQLFK